MDLNQPGHSHSDHSFWETPLWDRLDLFRSCRQIFVETAQAYFERWLLATRKYLTEVPSMCTGEETFEYLLAPSHRRVVRRAILFWYDLRDLNYATYEPCPLAEMVSLEEVEVQLVDHWTAIEVLEEMRGNLGEWTGKPWLEITFKNYDGLEVGPDAD
jgi:hypothetical protein